MATITEITLALGRTVYGGDQSGEEGSDEKIEGRETRLSVTWRLTEEEQDLTLMASVLAEEAERALGQAVQTVRKRPNIEEGCDTQAVPRLNREPDAAENIGHVSTERQVTERQTPSGTSTEGARTGNGNGHTPEPNHQPARTHLPVGSGQAVPVHNGSKAPAINGALGRSSASGNGSSAYPPYVPPITKTQQLAIQSHCTRHGVADWELRRLLWELFGKKEQRELNKDQAGELLTALQQHLLHNGADHPAYAN